MEKFLCMTMHGCSTKDILSAVGLSEKDLFNDSTKEKPKLVAEYIYQDENGNPCFKVMRFEPKNFRQAQYDNGNWLFKMTGARYVPYNLPNVIKADEVYFVEGEKDADNLNKIGLVATTTVSGASSFNKRAEEYKQWFKDKIVNIIPDNDRAGKKYAEDIRDSLISVAKEVKILNLSNEISNLPEKADISDVIEKYGKGKTLEIIELLKTDELNVLKSNLNKDNIFSNELFEKLYNYEKDNQNKFEELYEAIKKICFEKRLFGFDKKYRQFKKDNGYIGDLNDFSLENLNWLTEENVLSDELFEKLYEIEAEDEYEFEKIYAQIRFFCKSKNITGFLKSYKNFKNKKGLILEPLEYNEEEGLTQEEFAEIKNIIEGLNRDNVLSVFVLDKLYEYENESIEKYIKFYTEIKRICARNKITGFNRVYSSYKKDRKVKENNEIEKKFKENIMSFPDLNDNIYRTNQYEITDEGFIIQVIPNLGSILVCYHPILPVEKYINLEDGTEKIKIAYYNRNKWNFLIVDKSTISSSQSIVKLSDFGISVTSENAKFLVKYLAEIENLNKDLIEVKTSISRLGWFGKGNLVPYNDNFVFDNENEFPFLREKFGENGKLQEWIEFFRERRKYNNISRIVMAAGVASILLQRIKQPGFTVHIYGESETGKSVACMVGQSIFGNPSQNDGKGIGINFNFTLAGIESKLNIYNNIPLFVNEMQHQKDAKDYDKILFLISEGKGKTRSTKNGGNAKENSWNNIVITNGEKNIIKDNSNAGAYNRCISCEIIDYSFENLSEVADFVKENYGTPIREILKHLDDFDCKAIFKRYVQELETLDITNKQKNLQATLLLADKIIVDTLFKDEFYLTQKDFEKDTIKKKDVAVEERAYAFVMDWYVCEKRHFINKDYNYNENEEIKVEIYGRELKFGYVAIISSLLRKILTENGFDYNEVIRGWDRKKYIDCGKDRKSKSININGTNIRCIVLNTQKEVEDSEDEEIIENDMLPF